MLEWRTGEGWLDDEPSKPTRRPSLRLPRRWLLVPLIVAALAGAVYLAQAPARAARLRADIQATADLELWAWQTRDAAFFETLVDPDAPVAWRQQHVQDFRLFPQNSRLARRGTPQVAVADVDMRGDVALVTLRVRVPDYPSGPLDYTQAVPYRYVEGRWERTAPDERLWGRARTLTTAHFLFEYADRDADAVAAVAVDIERFYADLRAALALPPPVREKWTITLSLDPPLAPSRTTSPTAVRVTSPALAQMPLGMTPARHLKLAVGRWLGEALTQPDGWARPLSGVEVWNLPLAISEHDTLRWADEGFPPADSLRRPARWQTLRQTFDAMPATESLVDYVESAYGREALTAMMRAARGGATTWDILLPQALGVPRARFEADWLRYVEDVLAQVAARS